MLPSLIPIAMLVMFLATSPVQGRPGGFVLGHYYLSPEFDAPNVDFHADVDGDGRIDRIWCAEAAALDLYNLGVAMKWWSGDPVTPIQYELKSVEREHDNDNADVVDAFAAVAGRDALSKVFEVVTFSPLNCPSKCHAVLVLGAVKRGERRYFVLDDESTDRVGELLLVPLKLFLSNLSPNLLEFFGPVKAVEELYSVLPVSPVTNLVSTKQGRTLTIALLSGFSEEVLKAFTEKLWRLALEGYPIVVTVLKPFVEFDGVNRVAWNEPVSGDEETRSPLKSIDSGDGPSPPLGIPIPFVGIVGVAGLVLLLLTFLVSYCLPFPF